MPKRRDRQFRAWASSASYVINRTHPKDVNYVRQRLTDRYSREDSAIEGIDRRLGKVTRTFKYLCTSEKFLLPTRRKLRGLMARLFCLSIRDGLLMKSIGFKLLSVLPLFLVCTSTPAFMCPRFIVYTLRELTYCSVVSTIIK